MKERLNSFIISEGLSPALLADTMGIQRSGLSHILSGRNKPSFDFIEKIMQCYPRLNIEWLIAGKGSMYKSAAESAASSSAKPPSNLFAPAAQSGEPTAPGKSAPAEMPLSQPITDILTDAPKVSTKPIQNVPDENEKAVEQIVVLYADKTFVVYERG